MKGFAVFILIAVTAAVSSLATVATVKPNHPDPECERISRAFDDHRSRVGAIIADYQAREVNFSTRLTEVRDQAADLQGQLDWTRMALRDAESKIAMAKIEAETKEKNITWSAQLAALLRNTEVAPPPTISGTTIAPDFTISGRTISLEELGLGTEFELDDGGNLTAEGAWQYPQPIDPTQWIQQTLTPPPGGANGAWDLLRGK